MNFKMYQNEIIAFAALMFMLFSFIYKQSNIPSQGSSDGVGTQTLLEVKEAISLKKVWGDKKITKKVDSLKSQVSPSKVRWTKKSKKLTAKFSNISSTELNKVVTKILNIPMSIEKLHIQKSGMFYTMECKCKW